MFSESTLECVELPSTLKRIEYDTFEGCKDLKSIWLPERLEYIGKQYFMDSALESVELPDSLRTVAQGAFSGCASLTTAKFGEGLEALGTDEYVDEGRPLHGVFEGRALGDIKLPSSLKRIAYNAFQNCKNLKRIGLP